MNSTADAIARSLHNHLNGFAEPCLMGSRIPDLSSQTRSSFGSIQLIISQLAVEPQQVVLGKTEATDRCVAFQATMWPMPIVAMQAVEHFG
jgi:hypothetical protein